MSVVPYLAPPPARPTWIEAMDRGSELAEIVANTDFVPKGLRGNQPAIVAAILYGNEVGLDPMQALATIAVIDGKPTMSAEAMRALIQQHGHEIRPEEVTNTHATMVGRRRDSKQTVRVTWTMDDAKRAGLAGKANFQRYPRQMLVARATAELARQIFADVIHGMAATEELEDVVDGGEPTAIETAPTPAPATRRRRRPVPAPIAPDPEPSATPPVPSEGESAPPSESESADTPAKPDQPTDRALRKLFALFNQKGLRNRADRLAYSEVKLERKVGSSTELTVVDIDLLIAALEDEPDRPPKEPPAEPEPEPPHEPATFTPPPGAVLPVNEQTILTDLKDELDARPADDDQPPLPDEL